MPLLAPRLTLAVAKNLLKEFKKVLKAKKTPDQLKFGKAVAAGVIYGFSGAKGKIGSPSGGPSVGRGIKGLSKSTLAKLIVKKLMATSGAPKKGKASDAMGKAIATAVIAELGKATVAGRSGGRAKQFKSKSTATMAKRMLKASGWKKTRLNQVIFKAISQAVSQHVKAKGYSQIPPGGGSPSGSTATIK